MPLGCQRRGNVDLTLFSHHYLILYQLHVFLRRDLQRGRADYFANPAYLEAEEFMHVFYYLSRNEFNDFAPV